MKGPQQQGLNIDFKNTTMIEGLTEDYYSVKRLY